MANICYLEARRGENWREAVAGFLVWIQDTQAAENYAWSEDIPLQLEDGRMFYAYAIPPKHDIGLIARWAQETGRVYGFAEGGFARFPGEPSLTVRRPTFR